MGDSRAAPGRLAHHAGALSMQMGASFRNCQQHLGQLCSMALAAGAQMQISACQNVHNLAENVAHPSLRPMRRRRCRPSMMCCLSGALGGASAPSSAGNNVKFPRSSDVGSLLAGRDGGVAEANSTDSAAGAPEEPILISEVSS